MTQGEPGAQLSLSPKAIIWQRLKQLNPFYPGSAALILFGICLVLRDETVLDDHLSKLLFNFFSLQLYEICLIAAAVFLMRRRIIHDSLVLIIIEQVILLIPFMLHHGSFDTPQAILASGILIPIAFVTLAGRWTALALRCPPLNLPNRLWLLGLPILLVNAALPLLYWYGFDRAETDFKQSMFLWFRALCWFALPLFLLLPNLLKRVKDWPAALPAQPWAPFFCLTIWSCMTVFHLAWIPYVYDLHQHVSFFLPAAWALIWTLNNRFHDIFYDERPRMRTLLYVLPVAVAILLLHPETRPVARWLALINAVIYGFCAFRGWRTRISPWLSVISIGAFVLSFLSRASATLPPPSSLTEISPWPIQILLLVILVIALPMRRAAAGVAASLSVALLTIRFASGAELIYGRGVAVGFAFFLLHSIRWREDERLTVVLRSTAASAWFVYALIVSMRLDVWEPVLLNVGCCALPAAAFGVAYMRNRHRIELLTLVPSIGILLFLPIRVSISIYRSWGPGPALVIAAFAMLCIGTFFALRKQPEPSQRGNHRS